MSKPTASASANDEIIAYEGHSELRKILGPDFKMADVVTKKMIESCNTVLQEAAADFFTDSLTDLEALQQLCTTAAKSIADQATREGILKHTYNIKSHSKMLGFALITEICGYIVNTMNSSKITDEKRVKLFVQLVGGLRIAFDHKIRDDGGPIGHAIRQPMQKVL